MRTVHISFVMLLCMQAWTWGTVLGSSTQCSKPPNHTPTCSPYPDRYSPVPSNLELLTKARLGIYPLSFYSIFQRSAQRTPTFLLLSTVTFQSINTNRNRNAFPPCFTSAHTLKQNQLRTEGTGASGYNAIQFFTFIWLGNTACFLGLPIAVSQL